MLSIVFEVIKSNLIGFSEIVKILECIVDKMESEYAEDGSPYYNLVKSLKYSIEESKKDER